MSILEATIGLIAPPDCVACSQEGSALCLGCSAAEIVPYGEHCWLCNRVAPGGRTCPQCRPSSPRHVWITTNYDGAAQNLIKIYKFGHLRAAAPIISDLMIQTLSDFGVLQDIRRLNYLIAPVPTATSRLRRRGFGHSELLARTIARQLKLKDSLILGRLGQSRQLGAKRSERLKSPKDNYFVRSSQAVKDCNILLIDDVVTTGATIRAATKVLRRAGARRIDALVFAKKL